MSLPVSTGDPPREHPELADLRARLVAHFARHERVVVTADDRPAAVLLLVFERDGVPCLLLTKRSADLVHHPGQVSLPGGSMDPGDTDLAATALRETWEEVGIPPEAVDVLGMLDDVHVWVSGFVLTPVVGIARIPFAVTINPAEIERAMLVPVASVVDHDALLPVDAGRRDLRYPLDGEDVWGATGLVLRVFVRALTAG